MPKRKRGQDNSADTNTEVNGKDIVGGLKDPTGNTRSSGENRTGETGVSHLKIPFGDKSIICERRNGVNTESKQKLSLIFTHGAGGGIENPATKDFVTGFASEASSPTLCFQGTMNLKHRTKTFHAVIEDQGAASALGGRSMGARAAVVSATECNESERPEALVLVSYPLSAGGQQTKKKQEGDPRKQVLLDLPKDIDVLFVIGSGDAQCDLAGLADVRKEMKAKSWLIEVEGADHGMSLRAKAGVQPTRQRTGALAAEWLRKRNAKQQVCHIEWVKDEGEVNVSGWKASTASQPSAKKQKKKQ